MKSMKQMIEEMPEDNQEHVKECLRALHACGLWQTLQHNIKESIIRNWDKPSEELAHDVRRAGEQIDVYRKIELLSEEYVEEHQKLNEQ